MRDGLSSQGFKTRDQLVDPSEHGLPVSPNPPKGYGGVGQTKDKGSGNGLART